MAVKDRGFASMDAAKRKAIASKGGKAAHAKGTAHQWSSAEAREAGRKGGTKTGQRRAAKTASQPVVEGTAAADRHIDHDVSRFHDEGNPNHD